MQNSQFQNEAKKASQYAKEGLDQLVQIFELLESLKTISPSGERTRIIQEIIAKEKHAVGLIQQSTLIQRELMNTQHEAVEKLIGTL